MKNRSASLALGLALLMASTAVRSQPVAPALVDPFAISIDQRDADRFAALMRETGDRPTADQVQARYLDGAGQGVAVFTSGRIENAANLAQAIAADPARYRYAIETCLPLVASINAEMRSVYLAYRGLLPDYPLPSVHVVFGAGTSGGTASSTAQVIGLEVMCGPGTSAAQFRTAMRAIFAHETVHSWQNMQLTDAQMADPLLLMALREGTPDYLASMVIGSSVHPGREAWARPQEAGLWAEFLRDRATIQANTTAPFTFNSTGNAAFRRWFGNYGAAPDGWEGEAGYWVGMQIAAAYVERSPDRAKAIRELIALDDPAAILAASGYAPTD
jgi:hypothetical protein